MIRVIHEWHTILMLFPNYPSTLQQFPKITCSTVTVVDAVGHAAELAANLLFAEPDVNDLLQSAGVTQITLPPLPTTIPPNTPTWAARLRDFEVSCLLWVSAQQK